MIDSIRALTSTAAPGVDPVVDVLHWLRDDINEAFGVSEMGPRINQGPCGLFARVFFEIWNRLFSAPCRICFLVQADNPDNCYHCLLLLPDGRFFDGGYGVASASRLKAFLDSYFGPGRAVIEVMDHYDEALLDRKTYGRITSGAPVGPDCAGYSDDRARALIEHRLRELTASLPRSLR